MAVDADNSKRMRYDLEMAFIFAQIVMFRPFLHYLRGMAEGKAIPLSQSRYALACIKLASTAILRSNEIAMQCPNVRLSWDTCYTLTLSVMCLIFLISAHNGTSQPSEAWRRGALGVRLLVANQCASDCASTTFKVVKMVVRQLSHTVDFDFDDIEATTRKICEADEATVIQPIFGRLNVPFARVQTPMTPRPAAPVTPGLPAVFADADQTLAYAEDLPGGILFTDLLNMDLLEEDLNLESAEAESAPHHPARQRIDDILNH
jgi:hypothetical protein